MTTNDHPPRLLTGTGPIQLSSANTITHVQSNGKRLLFASRLLVSNGLGSLRMAFRRPASRKSIRRRWRPSL